MSLLVDILNHLLCYENTVRRQAEEVFDKLLVEECGLTIIGLFKTTRDSSLPFHIRQLSTVLLRRNLVEVETSAYYSLTEHSQQALLTELLRAVQEESADNIRLLITEITGELGIILDRDEWPALPQVTLTLCKASEARDRQVGLVLLGYIAEHQLHGPHKQFFLAESVSILSTNLTQPVYTNSAKLVVITVKALDHILQAVKVTSQIDHYLPLVPSAYQVLSSYMQIYIARQEHEDILIAYAECMVDICEHSLDLFANSLDAFLPSLLTQMLPQLTDFYLQSQHGLSILTLLIQFLVTLSSSKKLGSYKGPQKASKHFFAAAFFPFLCRLFLYFDESHIHQFSSKKSHVDHDANSLYVVAEQSLTQCLHVMGVNNKGIYNIMMETIHSFLSTASASDTSVPGYRYHLVAMQLIAIFIEITSMMSAEDTLALHQQEVLQLLSYYLLNTANLYQTYGDSVTAYMQYMVYYALSQFLLYHAHKLQALVCVQVASTLLAHLDAESTGPRALSYHGYRYIFTSLLNILENTRVTIYPAAVLDLLVCRPLALLGHMETVHMVTEVIYRVLVHLLESTKDGGDELREIWKLRYQAISSVMKNRLYAVLNLCAQTNNGHVSADKYDVFSEIYEILGILATLGESVEVNQFQQDGYEILQALGGFYAQRSNKEEDGSQYNMKAILRITKRLGQDPTPHLPSMLQHILTVLCQDAVISKQSTEDAEAPDVDEEDEHNIEVYDHPIEDQRYYLHKQLLANQLASLESLHYILSSQKATEESYLMCLLTYIPHLLPIIHKLTQHVYEDIRTNTLVLLPDLVRVLCMYSFHHQSSQRLGSDSFHNVTVLLPPGGSDVYNVYDIISSMLQTILENIRVYADQLDYCCTMCRVLKETLYQASIDRTQSQSALSDENFVVSFPPDVLEQVSRTLKTLIRDCLQRRAVQQAERQLHAADIDEDDENNSMAILTEAIANMYFHISEAFSVLIQSHSNVMMGLYDRDWRELVDQFLYPYVLPEDQALALDLLTALLMYGYRTQPIGHVKEALVDTFEKVIKIAHYHYESNYQDSDGVDAEVVETDRRVFYVLSLIIENYTIPLSEHLGDSSKIVWIHPSLDILYAYLQTLRSALPETPESFQESPLGACYDTILSTLGVVVYICIQMQIVPVVNKSAVPVQVLYVEYMKLWPLRFDQEESERSIYRLYRLLSEQPAVFFSLFFSHPQTLHQTLRALIDTKLSSPELLSKKSQKVVLQLIRLLSFHYVPTGNPSGYAEQIYSKLQNMHLLSDVSLAKDQVMQNMDPAYATKLIHVLDSTEILASQQQASQDSVFLTQTS